MHSAAAAEAGKPVRRNVGRIIEYWRGESSQSAWLCLFAYGAASLCSLHGIPTALVLYLAERYRAVLEGEDSQPALCGGGAPTPRLLDEQLSPRAAAAAAAALGQRASSASAAAGGGGGGEDQPRKQAGAAAQLLSSSRPASAASSKGRKKLKRRGRQQQAADVSGAQQPAVGPATSAPTAPDSSSASGAAAATEPLPGGISAQRGAGSSQMHACSDGP
eukprot:COSAG01_NODE_1775_length_9260_cov_58.468784_7_plen_219_part_00